MSKTTAALLVKLAMTLSITAITLGAIDKVPGAWQLVIAVLGTAVNYLLGDLVILPVSDNLMASVTDGLMAALLAYLVDLLVPAFTASFMVLVAFTMLIAFGEYFFHQYLLKSEKVAP
ncbi:MAG: DUF2512 family protein [Firmicutes bacterium]|nr:DUF2512 family protein [Bacillota bacterium]